jgi:DNA-binding MarR family transcriptional regulator
VQLPLVVSRVLNLLNLQLLDHLRPLNITPQQYRVALLLSEHEMLNIGEISRESCIEPSIVSRIVSKLESLGYAERRRNASNRRLIEVSITAEGARMIKSLEPKARKIIERSVADISGDEMKSLEETLQKIADTAGKNAKRSYW